MGQGDLVRVQKLSPGRVIETTEISITTVVWWVGRNPLRIVCAGWLQEEDADSYLVQPVPTARAKEAIKQYLNQGRPVKLEVVFW